MRELPLSAEGTRIATEENDLSVHLRRVSGDRLVLDPGCGDAPTFRRVLTAVDAFDIESDRWCRTCFPRQEES